MIGETLENYEIVDKLGEGGMGIVYKGIDTSLNRPVAIKMLSPELARDKNFIDRFTKEARALAQLNSPEIVTVYTFQTKENMPFIVMEYVDGITLAELIKNEGAIGYPKAFTVIEPIVTAINHAHSVGVIHRDIKPANIMITTDGHVKVTDFGLAKIEKGFGNTSSMTTGGTLYYMSPEQIRSLRDVDHRADIYSLGMTFYEFCAGKVPFAGHDSDYAIRKAIVEDEFPAPDYFHDAIPKELATIIMKAIKKNPDERYQNAGDMLRDIQKIHRRVTKLFQSTDQIGNINNLKNASSMRKRWPLLIGGAAIIFLLVLALFLFTSQNDTQSVLSVQQPQQVASKENQPPLVAKPEPATVFVQIIPFGSLTFENRLLAENTESPVQIASFSGVRTIQVVHPFYGTHTFSLDLKAGDNNLVKYFLESYINVEAFDQNGRPVRGELVVNNYKTGRNTPVKEFPVGPGLVEISVFKKGFTLLDGPDKLEVQPTTQKEFHSYIFRLKKL